jgi:hypothetical protein
MSADIPAISHDWATVRALIANPGALLSGGPGAVGVHGHVTAGRTDWVGGTHEQTCEWIRDGYDPPALPEGTLPFGGDLAPDPRLEWSDFEGELDREKLAFGDFEIYTHRAPRPSKPGLTLEIEYSAGARTPGSEIGNLGAWVGALVAALELRGYTLGVSVSRRIGDAYMGGHPSDVVRNRVVCSRMGEATRFADWSMLFAPTGYRHGLFTTACAHEAGCVPLEGEDAIPGMLRGDLGEPQGLGGQSIVEFDTDRRTLWVRWSGPDSGYRFPAKEYSTALARVAAGAGLA